jgi:hypothetical protein
MVMVKSTGCVGANEKHISRWNLAVHERRSGYDYREIPTSANGINCVNSSNARACAFQARGCQFESDLAHSGPDTGMKSRCQRIPLASSNSQRTGPF